MWIVYPDLVGSAFIWIQRNILKGKSEFNQQIFGVFGGGNYIFFEFEPKKVANHQSLGTDLKQFFLDFKRWVDINLVILLSGIRIRIHQILWIRIRSMRIHITAYI